MPIIEAVVIGLVVGGALYFAVAFNAPAPPAATHGGQELRQQVWDTVNALDNMHVDDPRYANNTLSRVVAESLAGDDANLTTAFDEMLPPGAQYNVYMNNGFQRLKVYESRSATGQTVGVAYPFEPRWRPVFAEPDLRYYTTDGNPTLAMGVTSIPLFNSNLIHDQGHTMNISASGTQPWLHGAPGQLLDTPDGWMEDAYSSLIQGNDQVSYPSGAIYMECATTKRPCYAVDLTPSEVKIGGSGYAPYQYDVTHKTTIPFLLENAGPADIPKNTNLTIEFPVGLEPDEVYDAGDNWTITTSGLSTTSMTVRAQLKSALPADGRVGLQVNVSAIDDRYAFKKVSARLSDGAHSVSQFLVRVEDKPAEAQTGGDTRTLFVSGPKPAGSVDGTDLPQGRWGVVLPSPVQKTTIENITIDLPFGPGVMDSAVLPTDYKLGPGAAFTDPTVKSDGTRLEWGVAGGHEIAPWEFFEIQFNVTTDGRYTQASERFPNAMPRTEYTGYHPPPMTHQTDLGIWWEEYPPRYDIDEVKTLRGYERDGNTFVSKLDYRNVLLKNQSSYKVADLSTDAMVSIKDALRAASVDADKLRYGPGEQAIISVKAQDLATFLSAQTPVNDLNVTTVIYPPWGIFERISSKSQPHAASAGVSHFPYDLELEWLDGDSSQDIVVAFSDGNVYSLAGTDGDTIPGRAWSLVEDSSSAAPTNLTKGRNSFGDAFYGVGSSLTAKNLYSIDMTPSATERWKTQKVSDLHAQTPNVIEQVGTFAINASVDLTGDGIPEMVASQSAPNLDDPSGDGKSRILLFYGNNGTLMPGKWNRTPTEGVFMNGTSDLLAMGDIGGDAKPGVVVNTGMQVGTNALWQANQSFEGYDQEESQPPENASDEEMQEWLKRSSDSLQDDVNEATNLSFGQSEAGLTGIYKSGKKAWNLSYTRFLDLQVADRVPTGGDWSGLVGAEADGFVYGINGKKGVFPYTGIEWIGTWDFHQVKMANRLEGYIPTGDGRLFYTDNAWTLWKPYKVNIANTSTDNTRNYPNVETVDTPAGSYKSQASATSWWGGQEGLLLRSTDQLDSVESLTTTGDLMSTLTIIEDIDSGDPGIPSTDPDATLESAAQTLTTLDLTTIDFEDIYAVSQDEAWFVGGGINGTASDDKAYVVHTLDGGDTLLTTEITCKEGTVVIDDCRIKAIDHDGERLWFVGTDGMVMVQNQSGTAKKASFGTDQGLSDGGWVQFTVDADELLGVKKLQLIWPRGEKVDWVTKVALEDASTNETLWEPTAGGSHINGKYDLSKGAGRGAILDLEGYDDDLLGGGLSDNNRWNGQATFRLGPFINDSAHGGAGEPNSYNASTFPVPTNLTFKFTYEDGSEDLITIGVGSGATDDKETKPSSWVTPRDLGYKTPVCFGAPNSTCANHHGINITKNPATGDTLGAVVGTNQTEVITGGETIKSAQWNMYRMAEGSTNWTAVENLPTAKPLYDVAANTEDLDRWLAVGGESRVLESYNKGINWTLLPKVSGDGKNRLQSVDFTNPDVGMIVGGGDQVALQFFAGGYTEWGQATTEDLYTGTDPIEEVKFDFSEFKMAIDSYGKVKIRLELWDENAGTSGKWITIFSEDTVNLNHTFEQPTTNITLRWRLSTVFDRLSPQVGGTIDLGLFEDEDNALPDTTVTFDPKSTGWIQGEDSLDIDATNGLMRLPSAHNPWVAKLGNHDGPWESLEDAGLGARPTDLDVSPDGWTVYVGTGGIYANEELAGATPTAYDNTVYALNITDGTIEKNWTLPRFDFPVVHVTAYEGGVYVATDNLATQTGRTSPKVYRLNETGVEKDSFSLAGDEKLIDMVVAQIVGPGVNDAVIAAKNTATDGGRIIALDHDAQLQSLWRATPQVKGTFKFTYDIPRNGTYGAYVIQTEFRWEASDKTGTELTQTGRLHNAFTVTTPNQELALSPTYTLEVVAWMEDWG